MWTPALARGLIREPLVRSRYTAAGYLELLESTEPRSITIAQRAMNNKRVAAVYERLWRPIAVAALSMHGLSGSEEHERAVVALNLCGAQRVLDVACGPGNFTRCFADRLTGDGLVIGLDVSEPMLERAVRDNSSPRAVYVHADAHQLPFDDGTFDAVSCFAALYLMPEPLAVLDEMVRVLASRGRIALMTSYGRESVIVRHALAAGARLCGVRVFDRDILPNRLRAAGLIDVQQQLRGISQFVSARKRR